LELDNISFKTEYQAQNILLLVFVPMGFGQMGIFSNPNKTLVFFFVGEMGRNILRFTVCSDTCTCLRG